MVRALPDVAATILSCKPDWNTSDCGKWSQAAFFLLHAHEGKLLDAATGADLRGVEIAR